jgi:hypothetical protein
MSEVGEAKVGDEEFRKLVDELQRKGRDMAEALLRTAVEGAKDLDGMNANLTVVRAAALSILAHDLYNIVEQKLGTREEGTARLFNALLEEAEALFSEENDAPDEYLVPGATQH